MQPSTLTHNFPHATIVGSELRIRYEWVQSEADRIKPEFDLLDALKRNVESSRGEVESHNAQLADKIRPRIQARKEKALRDKDAVRIACTLLPVN